MLTKQIRCALTAALLCIPVTCSCLAGTATAQETDTTAPNIYGTTAVSMCAGGHITDYISVFAQDDSGHCAISTDISTLNTAIPGAYAIRYQASDLAGNQTEVETEVYVLGDTPIATPEETSDIADKVLQTIITQDMTDDEKCAAVYDYVHAIAYTGQVYSDDWQQNAYGMLTYRGGDCTGYYAASRLLLEHLGYLVLKVENQSGFTHCWCLVSTDNGISWRHFDPTCWRWGDEGCLCMVTDEELDLYAEQHYNWYGVYTHSWNRDNYPEAR